MKTNYLISLLAHICLIIAMSYHHFSQSPPPTHLGHAAANVIQSYILSETNQIQKQEQVKKEIKKEKEVKTMPKKSALQLTRKKSLPAELNKPQEVEKKTVAVSQVKQISKGEAYAGLKVLLHQAIQQQQIYPDSMQLLQREGRVKVKFKLYPDGHIDTPTIQKSSGTPILDAAAIAAVSKAAPFAGVQAYLTVADEFDIDVVFELT